MLLTFQLGFMSRQNFEMSQHKKFFSSYCVTTVFSFLLFILCRDIKFLYCDKYFCLQLFNFTATYFAMLRYFFLWFFSTFVAIILSFVVTEFLIVACCCCYERYFLCRNIILLSSTAKSELYVVIYFLP